MIPRLSAHFERFGGMLVAPRTTLQRLLTHDEGRMGAVVLWLCVLQLAVEPERVGRAVLVARVDLFGGLQIFANGLARRLTVPLAGAVVAALILSWLARRRRVELPFDRALDVAAYLLVPFLLVSALSAVAAALGFDAWWAPHRALRGSALVVSGRAVAGFAGSLALFGLAARELTQMPGAPNEESPIRD